MSVFFCLSGLLAGLLCVCVCDLCVFGVCVHVCIECSPVFHTRHCNDVVNRCACLSHQPDATVGSVAEWVDMEFDPEVRQTFYSFMLGCFMAYTNKLTLLSDFRHRFRTIVADLFFAQS